MRGRAWIIVLVAFGSITAGITTSDRADALVPAADFQFSGPTLLFDTRVDGQLASGVERGIGGASTRTIANVTLFGGTQPSWIYFHPCGVAVDRTKPAASFAEANEPEINLAPIDASACMTRFGDAGVRIVQIGVQDSTPGLDYVAHAAPVDITVTPTAGQIRFNVRDAAVPAGAEAVAIWVGVGAADGQIAAIILSTCGGGGALTEQTVVAPSGGFNDNLVIAPIDAGGDVCFDTLSATAPEFVGVRRYGYLQRDVTATAEGLPYSGWIEQRAPGFVSLAPDRLFDTRDGGGLPLDPGEVASYQFTGLPADATAVALNITATSTGGPGFVSAYPCDAEEIPVVSNVNFTGAGQTVPNFSIVSLGSTQEICFYASTTTHLLADVSGYFLWDGGDGFVPGAATRVFDTRDSGARVAAGGVYTLDLTGRIGADATAIVMNVTATNTTADGFVTAFPCGQDPPRASNLNFRANQTRPNLVTVKVPSDLRVCFFASAATHLFADLAGWYAPTSNIGMFDVEPFRTFDSREPAGEPPLDADSTIFFEFDDRYLRAVAWNLTATQTAAPGFVTGFPCSLGLPKASNVNYTAPGQTVANFAFLQVDGDNRLCFYTLARTHLIADEAGYFVVPVPFEVFYDGAPPRLTGAAAVAERLVAGPSAPAD